MSETKLRAQLEQIRNLIRDADGIRHGLAPTDAKRLLDLAFVEELEYRRPPRTGYRGDDGVFHPAPDWRDFDRHADVCPTCDAERDDPHSGYVNRRGPRVSGGPYR